MTSMARFERSPPRRDEETCDTRSFQNTSRRGTQRIRGGCRQRSRGSRCNGRPGRVPPTTQQRGEVPRPISPSPVLDPTDKRRPKALSTIQSELRNDPYGNIVKPMAS
jgi:hypothetical protein